MTLQEIIKSFENLSVNEQDSLLAILAKQRQEKQNEPQSYVTKTNKNEETFWEMTLRFRQLIEKESIEFNDEDFANLRDTNPGKEVEFEL